MVVSVWKTPQTQEGTGCLQESFCWLLKGRQETKIRADFCLGPVVREFVLALAGVHNVTALGNLITWQKVDYDFNYHRMEFPCNINVLITSEGRSLLPVWEGLLGSAGELQLAAAAQSRPCQGQVGTGNVSCDQGGCDTGRSCCLLPRGCSRARNLFMGKHGDGASLLLSDQGW